MADEILVVEDDDTIRRLLKISLRTEGYRVSEARTGAAALSLVEANAPALVLLDLGLPDCDGMDVLARVREEGSTPVIVVTARNLDDQKVRALDAGADDYVVKPFKPRELMARVKARIRRASQPANAPSVLEARDITVDEASFTAMLHGEPLSLTPKEFAILACLVRHAGQPLPSKDLFETVWNEEANAQSANTVMVHVRHLRKKLACVDSSQEFIETVWGVGYRIG